MPRKIQPPGHRRKILNLTIHPDIRAWVEELARIRRRSISLLFEELVEAEWHRRQSAEAHQPHPAPHPYPPAGAPHSPQ